MELLLLALMDESGFISIILQSSRAISEKMNEKMIGRPGCLIRVFNHILVTKFGCRYFPEDTSSYARRSFTFLDSKSMRLSSKDTVRSI